MGNKIRANDLTLGEALGEGNFGTVYKGVWREREVAVKTMRTSKVTKHAVNDFRAEVVLMAPLQHPNLVNLLGACWEDGPDKLFIVLELCTRGSLDDLMKDE